MFNFERLEVWHKAIAFSDLIHEATKSFPNDERFGLTNQISRAANSVSSNIAEGAARTNADFARFVGYATGSLFEVVSQSFLARRRGYLAEDAFRRIYADAEEIARMLSGLRKSLGE
jgi:four helix bundle protein